jgi:putative pyoverdin transport system ATP-binding/permease protein
MNFLRLLRTETAIDLRRLFGMAVIAGLSNAMVLAIINSAASAHSRSSATLRLGIMFVTVLIAYTISQRYLMFEASKEIERIIHRVRSRLVEAVRESELPEIERIGRARIFNAVSKEIQSLAQNTNTLVAVAQMAVLVVFAIFYLMALSMTAFLLALVFMGIAVVIYLGRMKAVSKAVQDSFASEYGLHDLLTGVLDGFKEIKLNALRSQTLADDLVDSSLDAAESRIKAQSGLARNFVFTQNVFFILLGTMVFIVPILSSSYGDTVVKTTTAVLFVIGPIAGVVSAVPVFINANASAGNIMALEQAIGSPSKLGMNDGPLPSSFGRIELRDVTFTFERANGESDFRVGPINLAITAGETVFISGGNGSGKSTLMRLLTSLYWPQIGTVSLDGVPVTHENVGAYRALFCAVFSDYHLFKRLYGVQPDATDEAAELLRLFEIDDKTALVGDAFTNINLSAGQRKRLALIVALLERRPICVLDEWAADQDPLFRRKFYEELLPIFKARGMTIIAVTHDDRYFHVADRRLHVEEGKIVSEQTGAGHA